MGGRRGRPSKLASTIDHPPHFLLLRTLLTAVEPPTGVPLTIYFSPPCRSSPTTTLQTRARKTTYHNPDDSQNGLKYYDVVFFTLCMLVSVCLHFIFERRKVCPCGLSKPNHSILRITLSPTSTSNSCSPVGLQNQLKTTRK